MTNASEQLRAAAHKLTHPDEDDIVTCVPCGIDHPRDDEACLAPPVPLVDRSASGHPVPQAGPSYAEVMAERYTEAAGNAKGRAGQAARLYATLHALMAFLDAHPDLPIPTNISLVFHDADMDLLQRIAGQHGTDLYPAEDPRQVTVWPVGQVPDAEFWMPYSISLARPDRSL